MYVCEAMLHALYMRHPTHCICAQVQTRSNEASIFTRPVIAYHGTCMENLHSILNTGLLNFSGTRMGRNGAIFGNGIYLR